MENNNEIIITKAMGELFGLISQNNNVGIFRDTLTDEDRKDVVGCLMEKGIPVLVFYSEIEPTYDPRGSSCPYDDDYIPIEVSYDCIDSYTLNAVAKEYTERIKSCDVVSSYDLLNSALDVGMSDDEMEMLKILRYSKKVAKILQDFSKVGVILDRDDLAPKMMGEFFPGYCNSGRKEAVYKMGKVVFEKSKMRFSNEEGECNFRKGSAGYYLFQDILIDDKEFISYSELLEKTKDEGHYKNRHQKMKDNKKYIERRFKGKMDLDMEIMVLDKENEKVMLSSEFRELLKIEK